MTIDLTDKLLGRLSTFFKIVARDIDEHLCTPQPPEVKPEITHVLKTPSSELDKPADEPYKKFILSKTKTKTTHRKKQDTTKLSVEDYRWVVLSRRTTLSTVKWQEFADDMNTLFGVNKSKNTWANIVNRKTAYLQTLDY